MAARWLDPARGRELDWGPAAAAHLLRRAAFGAAPRALEAAVDRGPEATVAGLFAAAEGSRPDGAIGLLLAAGDVEPLQAWWVRALCSGPGPLRERATLVWHGHFATSQDKVADVRLMHAQNVSLREHALADFRGLLTAMLTDAAMLVWLDGSLNRKGAPNENLARELFELFSLGRGHYAETDVREAARALSGWRVVGRRARLEERERDDGVKQVLGRRGDLRVEDVVDAVLEQPACAAFVARRLVHEYVGPAAPAGLEAEVADDLRARGLDLGATLARLLASRGFFAPAVRAGRIGSPLELLAGAARALGAAPAPTRSAHLATRLGQAPFRPPTVEGWEGDRAWIGSTRWIARRDLAGAVASAWAAGAPADTPSEPGTLVDHVFALLLPGRPAPPWRAEAVRAVGAVESAREARATAAALTLASPEFQLV